MLTQLTSRLASQLNDLTIQVVKEDLTLPSMPLSRGSSSPSFAGRILPSTEGKPFPLALVGQGKTPATVHVGQTMQKHSLAPSLSVN